MQPEASIIIPLHDAAQWIVETLQSVVASRGITPGLMEIIVVDDGSADEGPELARKVLEKQPHRYTVLRHDRARGAGAARNTGWRVARGRWIRFLDADDLLHPDAMRAQLDAAEAHPPTSVIYSPWQRLYAADVGGWAVEAPRMALLDEDVVGSLIDAEGFIPMGSYLVSRAAVERVGGFDETQRNIQDVRLLISVALDGGRFLPVHTAFAVLSYREVPGSLSKSDARSFVEGCMRNARLVEVESASAGMMTPVRRQRVLDVYFQAARYFAGRDWEAFERVVRLIEALHPGALPSAPRRLRALTRAFGYRRAERIAAYYRKLRLISG